MKPGCIALCIAGWLGAQAPLAAQAPEIVRPAAAPQPTGAVHTLRQIPEACARIEGVFTGDADGPYRFSVVQTSPACQPRARLVDAAKARPSEADGWIFHDLIRVPNAACPSQQAVVRIWRLLADQKIELDGQGRARIYLKDAMEGAGNAGARAVPLYAAEMKVEGGCR